MDNGVVGGGPLPTPSQINTIKGLVKSTGAQIDWDKVTSVVVASNLIKRLMNEQREKRKQKAASGTPDLHGKELAFGMVTKLMFKRYVDMHKTPSEKNGFWKDVEAFYNEFREHQRRVTSEPEFTNADVMNATVQGSTTNNLSAQKQEYGVNANG